MRPPGVECSMSTPPPAPSDAATLRGRRVVLVVAVLASFVAFLDGSIVTVALPAIARELGDDALTGAGLFCASASAAAGVSKGDTVLRVPLRCVLSRERASGELRRLAGGEERERAEGEVDALLLYLVVARLAMQRREDG